MDQLVGPTMSSRWSDHARALKTCQAANWSIFLGGKPQLLELPLKVARRIFFFNAVGNLQSYNEILAMN